MKNIYASERPEEAKDARGPGGGYVAEALRGRANSVFASVEVNHCLIVRLVTRRRVATGASVVACTASVDD